MCFVFFFVSALLYSHSEHFISAGSAAAYALLRSAKLSVRYFSIAYVFILDFAIFVVVPHVSLSPGLLSPLLPRHVFVCSVCEPGLFFARALADSDCFSDFYVNKHGVSNSYIVSVAQHTHTFMQSHTATDGSSASSTHTPIKNRKYTKIRFIVIVFI